MDDAPELDSRSYDELVAQTEALATAYTGGTWRPSRDGAPDLGGVMVRLFGTMVAHVVKQLNRVPDKHHRAFTRLLGAVRITTRAARAAITFQLDDGSRTTTVPAGAEIAGTGADGVPVVFETERDLALTRARLAAVFVRDVAAGRYADRTVRALGLEPQPYDALGAAEPQLPEADPENHAIEHEVYLAFESVTVRGATTMVVTATGTGELPTEAVEWHGFQGGHWVRLPPAPAGAPRTWRLDAGVASLGPVEIAGTTARWLRASFPAAPPPLRVTAGVSIDVKAGPLEAAIANGQPADLTRDLLPFGERPRVGDVFYIAGDDAFAIAGATVTLEVTIDATLAGTLPKPNASLDLELRWEAWDGQRATLLGTSKPATQGTAPVGVAFVDSTQALTRNGTVTLTIGTPIPRATIVGVTSRWVRVRIAAGNYGVDVVTTVVNGVVTMTPASYRPPAMAAVTLAWTGTIGAAPPARIVRRTARTYEDLTPSADFAELYLAAPELAYQATTDTRPSLHLGFDRGFEPVVTTLYLQALPPPAAAPADYTLAPPPREPPGLAWEFWNGAAWTPFAVEDGTGGLARSGLVRFRPPADAQPLRQFGQTLWWLRARALAATFAPMPRLGRIATNTMWASNAHTITDEVLGGSNAARDQAFTLSQHPVLDGQRIEVGEPEPPPPSELARLGGADDDVVTAEHATDQPPRFWVRWQRAPDFWASGPRDRHYTLDAATGRITFGNGTRGMIPPTGAHNVRAAWYRAGGGAAGNVAAGVLAQLKTTVPVVRGAVNAEAAVGGADLEPVPAMMERAARTMRHGGRAVTAADYVDLALESSTAIARAVALTPSFVPIDQGAGADLAALQRDGRVIVVVVPAALRPGEAPTIDLLAEVEDYLRARSAPGAQIAVTGPSWVAARITVEVVARSLDDSDAVVARVREAIARLLDPITGGDGAGWPFGRRPRPSDVIACLAAVSGVDHSFVDVRCQAPFDRDDLEPDAAEISVHELSLSGRLLAYAETIVVSSTHRVTR